jgi:hypothetical protein
MSKPRFECVAISGELIAPKEDGKEPSVGVKMRVVSGPATGEEKFWYGSLTGGAAEYTIQALRTMGWTGNDLNDLAGLGSVRFAAVEDVKTLPAQGTRPPKKITQYQIWAIEGRARLDENEGKAMAARFKALAAQAPVAVITDGNKAPDVLPAAKATNGMGSTTPTVEGPSLSGTQF